MTKSILIIGSGAREHALGWKLKQSKQLGRLYFAPGNPGTAAIGENVSIDATDIKKLLRFAKIKKIDLTVVGPETPLVLGIADVFRKANLNIIGPSKKASQIEGSKIFAKELMNTYNIPTAKHVAFKNFRLAKIHLDKATYPIVVKADGLCMGKGVAVCHSKKEAVNFLKELVGQKIIIEECLVGQEVSCMVITDGKDFLSFLPSQDHKRLRDNNKGPNTGGMGAYTPLPFVDSTLLKRIEKEIVAPTIKAMDMEGCKYQGILYPGIILTKDGPKVLEYNCRFGDPETQALMMQLDSDLLQVFQSQVNGTLKNTKLVFKKGYSVSVTLASLGYPGAYKKGDQIFGLDKKSINVQIFHAGTKRINKKYFTNGGRILSVASHSQSLKDAIKIIHLQIGKNAIHFKGMQYRKDIGQNHEN